MEMRGKWGFALAVLLFLTYSVLRAEPNLKAIPWPWPPENDLVLQRNDKLSQYFDETESSSKDYCKKFLGGSLNKSCEHVNTREKIKHGSR